MHSNGRCERLWLHPCGPEIFYFIFFKHAIHDCFSKIPFRTSFIFTFYHPEEVMCSPRIILAQLFFLAVSSILKWNEKWWMGCNCILIHSWEENCIWKNKVQKEERLLSFDWLFFLWMMCDGPKNARCVIMKWKCLHFYSIIATT